MSHTSRPHPTPLPLPRPRNSRCPANVRPSPPAPPPLKGGGRALMTGNPNTDPWPRASDASTDLPNTCLSLPVCLSLCLCLCVCLSVCCPSVTILCPGSCFLSLLFLCSSLPLSMPPFSHCLPALSSLPACLQSSLSVFCLLVSLICFRTFLGFIHCHPLLRFCLYSPISTSASPLSLHPLPFLRLSSHHPLTGFPSLLLLCLPACWTLIHSLPCHSPLLV